MRSDMLQYYKLTDMKCIGTVHFGSFIPSFKGLNILERVVYLYCLELSPFNICLHKFICIFHFASQQKALFEEGPITSGWTTEFC